MKQENQIKANHHSLTNFTFLILGLASLSPWNAVLQSQDYYKTKCKYKNFPFVFILPNIAASYLFGFYILIKSSSLSHTIKMYIPLTLSIVFMLLTPATAYILDTTYGYILFFIAVFFSAALTTVLQMVVLGIAGQTEPLLLSYFAIGTGVSGILTSLIRIIDLLVFNEGLKDVIQKTGQLENKRFIEEMVYYIINVLFFALAGLLFYKFTQNDSFEKTYQKVNDNKESSQNLLNNDNNQIDLNSNEDILSSNKHEMSICYVFKKSIHYQLLILLLTTQTFFLFPGIALKKQLNFLNMDWKNAFLLLVFNFSDTLGKGINLLIGNFTKCRITVFCLLRLILTLPFLLLARNAKFYLFQCDWFPFLLMFLFGLTNGLGFTQIIIQAAKLFKNKRNIEICEQLLFILFTSGTTVGTFIAFGMSKS